MFPHAAITAAALAARRAQEEEKMTTYGSDDLNGWEFKIVRSNFGRFGKLEAVQQVCREEAESGWELVEKFDQYRLRFKRRIEHRSRDNAARLDPYRTSATCSVGGGKVVLLLGLLLVVIGLISYLIFGIHHRTEGLSLDFPIVLALLLAVLTAVVAVRKLSR